jgi:hypothetical protein
MLKFSGYSESPEGSRYFISALSAESFVQLQIAPPLRPPYCGAYSAVQCAFKNSMIHGDSHYVSHFAALFIDARTKRSVVESCILYRLLLRKAVLVLRHKCLLGHAALTPYPIL